MQAKDVEAERVLGAIQRVEMAGHRWATRWQLEEAFPDVPPKVLLAKCRRLILAGKIEGCFCGCRGDFTTEPY